MSDSSGSLLPYRAKGIDFGEAVLVLANDKLIMTSKVAQYHFTVHLGTHSQVLDIHKTFTATNGSTTHTRLFTISHANLAALVKDIAPAAVGALKGVLRPLRPGWMAKRRVGAVVGLFPAKPEYPLVTKLRHGKLVVDLEKLLEQAWTPEFLGDLYELPDGQMFTLFSCNDPNNPKMIGAGFKFTEITGRRRLVWLKKRRVAEAFKRIDMLLQSAAARYGTFHKLPPW